MEDKIKVWRALAILLAALTGLNGCAALDPFVEPINSQSANLRLSVSSPSSFKYCVAVATVNFETCQGDKMIGAISCRTEKDEERLGIPGSVLPIDGVLERKVPSGNLFSIAPYMIYQDIPIGDLIGNPSKYMNVKIGACATPSFKPETGKNYELNFSPSPGRCDISLFEIQDDGARVDITGNQNKYVELISNNNNTGSLLCDEKSDDWVE
ncbi:MAG: hypothetical protein Q8R10_03065 [Pseudomonas sp.]|uniref:hypothetical protein n=1 Tax=Pseudomonas sp. TaxID=306 RepID=UPI00273230DF|nr:hypothetical protein [Pseudomonas sp.]MDP3845387.1 hypothetical protein [Pseudomonas sp.]